jgi:hypothetical protein
MRKWFSDRRKVHKLSNVLAAIFTTRDLPTVSVIQVGQKKK